MLRAAVAQRGQRQHEGPSRKGALCAERQCAQDVHARHDATVEHDRAAVANAGDDGGKHIDTCRRRVELTAPMVRDHDTVDAQARGSFGIPRDA